MPYIPSHELECNYIMIALMAAFFGFFIHGNNTCRHGYHPDALLTIQANPHIDALRYAPQPPEDIDYKQPESYRMVCVEN